MKRFALFILALAGLPLCWAVARSAIDILSMQPNGEGMSIPAGTLGLWAGFGTFLALWLVRFRPVKTYVFGHEMTHAIVGLCFGAKPSNLKVTMKGGSVQLTKSNVWITLSPYFVPFYTILAVIVAAVARLCMGTLPFPPAWMFAVGFTWCFHLCFTIKSLGEEQPDVKEYGRLFSWELIFLFNAAGILIWVSVMSGINPAHLLRTILSRTTGAYGAVYGFVVNLLPERSV